MAAAGIRFERHPLRAAPKEFVDVMHELDRAGEIELQPDRPPPSHATFVANWCVTPSYRDTQGIVAWDGDEPVGSVLVEIDRSGDNDHLLEAYAYVVPDRRRQGLGRALVATVLDLAEAEGRRLVLGFTGSSVPAGAEFLRFLGAEPGLEERESELDLRSLDRSLVERWLAEGPGRAPGYELVTIEGDVPEELVEPYAALYGVTSTAPRGTLELGDTHRTPDQVREADRARRESGAERILCIVRALEDGDLAGFTVLSFHPEDPGKIDQNWTAVDPAHRGHGLGKWLKAAALVRALERWPSAVRITTGNAYTNAAMLAINDALGFRETIGWTVWQVPVADARQRLDSGSR
jgi:mycothiol synthase